MSLLSNTLSNNSFYITNKKLIKALGPNASMILTHLIDQHKYLESKNELQPDGSFFCRAKWIESELNIGEKARRSAFKLLEKMELISVHRKGMPSAFYYILNDSKILAIIQDKKSNDSKKMPRSTTSDLPKDTTSGLPRSALNKNKENKNKSKQKLESPLGRLEVDLKIEDLKEEELRSSKEDNTIPESDILTPEKVKQIDSDMLALVGTL